MAKIIKISCVMLLICFLFFRDICFLGASQGVTLCITTVIPAVFPFAVACRFFTKCGICTDIGRYFGKIAKKLFNIGPVGAGALVLGAVCGYPVGACNIGHLYKSGKLTKRDAEALCAYSNAPNPSFLIGFAGGYVLKSAEKGFWVFVCTLLSSLLYAFFNRKNMSGLHDVFEPFEKQHPCVLFVSSVCEAANSMLYICGYTVFFCVTAQFCKSLPINTFKLPFLLSLCELITGLSTLSTAPIGECVLFCAVCAFSSFTGLCAICQSSAECVKNELSPRMLLKGKTVQGFISIAISYIIYSVFLK